MRNRLSCSYLLGLFRLQRVEVLMDLYTIIPWRLQDQGNLFVEMLNFSKSTFFLEQNIVKIANLFGMFFFDVESSNLINSIAEMRC